MKTVFLRSGTSYRPASEADLDMHEVLPGENFVIAKHPITEALFFQQVDPFTLPSKLYGDIDRHASRILNTYQDRGASTGVLLNGEKGSGKTQLARLIAAKAATQYKIPCIIINQPYVGDEFNKLIQSVHQECVVLFDEFEKTYGHDDQRQVLTLLDGVFPTKKLFILTCNDKWLINEHMRNRPGRLYYALDFTGLKPEFINEYCQDRLRDKSQIPKIQSVAQMFSQFNFDMLQAIVEEMNRYNETVDQVLELLNARPTTDTEGTYEVALYVDGAQLPSTSHYPRELEGSPMNEQEISISYQGTDNGGSPVVSIGSSKPTTKSRGSPSSLLKIGNYSVRQQHLKSFDSAKGQFVYFVPEVKLTVLFTRVTYGPAKYSDLF